MFYKVFLVIAFIVLYLTLYGKLGIITSELREIRSIVTQQAGAAR